MLGVATAPGPWLAKYRASGTTIIPAMTVSTNVTAPHSRRSTAQFTSGKFYLDPSVAIRPDSFRPPPDVLSPTASRRPVWEVGVPRGRTSVLTRALEIVTQASPSGRIHSGRHQTSYLQPPPGVLCVRWVFRG